MRPPHLMLINACAKRCGVHKIRATCVPKIVLFYHYLGPKECKLFKDSNFVQYILVVYSTVVGSEPYHFLLPSFITS